MNIVHIGLPKTASTTLQNRVFAAQDQFAYIGKTDNLYSDLLREFISRISFQDSLDYDTARVDELVAAMRNGQNKPVLVSDEIFSVEGRTDRRIVAERLHRLFAPAKILVVVRAQTAFLQSMYLNHVRGGGQHVGTFADWLDETYGDIRFNDIYRVAINYEPLVRTYEDVFGAENVVVLPFELINDPESMFARELAVLLDMPLADIQAQLARKVDNQRMSTRHLAAVRLQDMMPAGANLATFGRRMLPQPVYQLGRRIVLGGRRVESPQLTPEWRERIGAMCANGNARLEARKNIPLRGLGYPVGG